jgi:methylglyoxal synthase
MKDKTIALVAHDACKKNLADWVAYNWEKLIPHRLICTGTTGSVISDRLEQEMGSAEKKTHINMKRLLSGPLGGDQQLGAMIADGEIDLFIFLWDTMSAQPHDVDVKALLRISTMYNIPTACNRTTADYLISSPLFELDHPRHEVDFSYYKDRKL